MPLTPISFQPRRYEYKSNAERQRAFRRAHPDYNRLYQARRRAEKKALKAAQMAPAAIAAPTPAEPVAVPVTKPQLLLPAPVVVPVLPGINTIESRAERLERLAVWLRNATARECARSS